ncbi:hypothetical protein GCM10023346_22030 [Arthrobacter gyeryongensis]|uniref:PilZ domain-containing protein n=1 Tax=Arthrobacter gyeryongensis TaxID=1650592 RepID=A0ABP9SF09_9MICC
MQTLRRNEPYLMTRWKYLWCGEFVELRREGREIDSGWVDDVSPDGTVMWIHLTTGRGRIMIHVNDGLDVWRVDTRILLVRTRPAKHEASAVRVVGRRCATLEGS